MARLSSIISAYNQGGALRLAGGTVTVINTTVSDNLIVCSICSGAAALYVGSAAALGLTNVTLTDNPTFQGAMLNVSSGLVTLHNVILRDTGNLCANSSGTITSFGHNLSNTSDAECGLSQTGDISGIDPALAALAFNGGPTKTRLPAANSPIVGKGQCLPAVPVDQRGVLRPAVSGCDIDAVQREVFLFLPIVRR